MEMIPKETDKPLDMDGATVTIVDKNGAPNEEYLSNGKNDDNSVIPKSFIDAMGTIPGRRFEGPKRVVGTGRPELEETISDVAGSAADAFNAAKDAYKTPAEGDTLNNKPGESAPMVGENGQWTERISDTTSILKKAW